MLTVHYHDSSEFLAELRGAATTGELAYPLIRLTGLYQASGLTPNIVYVSVVATFVVGPPGKDPYLVRLDRSVGYVWGLNNGRDSETYHRRDEVQEEIGTVAGELQLDVRGGAWGPIAESSGKGV